jgi:protein-S-isoprenylcysteine O-methyltransferase Ste14
VPKPEMVEGNSRMASSALPVAKSVTESWIFTHRSWIGVACLAPAGLAVIFSTPWITETSPLALFLDFAGWLLFLAYLAMRLWATLYVGGVKDKILQTTGPYSITRNPLYLGGLCFALSTACFLKSISLVVLTLVASAAYVHWVVPAEEEVLESIFGDAYREYGRRTPRMIPSFSRYTASPTVEVRLRALRTEAKRLFTASMMPILVFCLLHFRNTPWWPHWFTLP